MKKLIVSLLMVIGIQISVFSQNTYPKKILWENDTVLAITKSQLITINRSLNDYIHLRSILSNLQMDLTISDSIIDKYKKTISLKDSIINKETEKYESEVKLNNSLRSSLEKEQSKRKTLIGVGVGGSVIGLLIGFLLSK